MLLLSGGTGSPKLLRGLLKCYSNTQLTVIANTGDDLWVSGNLVCPDVDTVIYTLAGISSDRWWGVKNDTFLTNEALASLGHEEALLIGDLDRATHIFRTELLRHGKTLTEATSHLCASFKILSQVLPMANEFVPTMIETHNGELHIQDFLVKHKQQPDVVRVKCGIGTMTAEVKVALNEHKAVVIGPSNPISSIGPILKVKGMKKALKDRFVVAVSPIVQSEPVSGPAHKFMRAEELPVSSAGVALFYSDFLDVLIVDNNDFEISRREFPRALEVVRTNTIMRNAKQSEQLAAEIQQLLAQHI